MQVNETSDNTYKDPPTIDRHGASGKVEQAGPKRTHLSHSVV